jgi:hypothetical protein
LAAAVAVAQMAAAAEVVVKFESLLALPHQLE